MPKPLTDAELAAYAQWASNERDLPLASLVAELQLRRANGERWAILLLPPGHAALLPHLIATLTGPVRVIAPEGTKVPGLEVARHADCVLETYDPGTPADLRARLRANGLG